MHHLGGAGGVVDRDHFDPAHLGERLFALRQRLRVRVDDGHVLDPGPGQAEQAVIDAQFHLADDRQDVVDEQVVVAMDAAADGVLHRQDAVGGALVRHGGEHVFERGAGEDGGGGRVGEGGGFAIGAGLALERDAHPAA